MLNPVKSDLIEFYSSSLYGSRQLAKKWEKENKLKDIGIFILLDLIGAPNPTFVKLFNATSVSLGSFRFT